jgi:hypothetical protein
MSQAIASPKGERLSEIEAFLADREQGGRHTALTHSLPNGSWCRLTQTEMELWNILVRTYAKSRMERTAEDAEK